MPNKDNLSSDRQIFPDSRDTELPCLVIVHGFTFIMTLIVSFSSHFPHMVHVFSTHVFFQFEVAILTALLLLVKTFALCPCHYNQELLPGKYRCFSRLWQQNLNFANLPLLGSCTYSHSDCPGAPNACVKYVAHRASCLLS